MDAGKIANNMINAPLLPVAKKPDGAGEEGPGAAGDAFVPSEAGDGSPSFDGKARDWTVLMYLNSNGGLQQFFADNVRAASLLGSDDKINFVGQMSFIDYEGFVGGMQDRWERKLYRPSEVRDFEYISHSVSYGKDSNSDMGCEDTLRDFVAWGMKTFPAEHYLLLLGGHGGGFVGAMPNRENSSCITAPALESALKSATDEAGRKIDVLVMESCLMGNAETAYAVKDSARYYAASEETIPATKVSIYSVLSKLKNEANGDGLTVEEACSAVMEGFGEAPTFSITDCNAMPGFAERLREFSHALMNTGTPAEVIKESFGKAQRYNLKNDDSELNTPGRQMRDVVSLCLQIAANPLIMDEGLKEQARMTARHVLETVVMAKSYNRDLAKESLDYSGSNGISIYAPTSGVDLKPAIDADGSGSLGELYSKTSLARDTGWDAVVKKYGVQADVGNQS